MSFVGSFVRIPGVVRLPYNAALHTITRGQLVNWDSANGVAQAVPAAGGAKVFGVALSDGDPDTNEIAIGVRGGYTVPAIPSVGYTPAQGDLLYADSTKVGTVTSTATSNTLIGWCVTKVADAQQFGSTPTAPNCLEMAFLIA